MTAAPAPSGLTSAQAVTFTVGDLRLAMDVGCVREIVRSVTPVRVPHAPADVAGVFDWRGRLIPLIDLRTRFGLGVAGRAEHARAIVVESGGRCFGLAVDHVHTIVRFDHAEVRAASPAGGGCAAMLPDMRAIEGTDLILIDPGMFPADHTLN